MARGRRLGRSHENKDNHYGQGICLYIGGVLGFLMQHLSFLD